MKKLITAGLILTLLTGTLAACGSNDSSSNAESKASGDSSATSSVTLKIGASITPHAEILNEAKPILEKDGIILDIVEFEDTVTPNTALAEGSLDANFFQHQPYLDNFNEENKTTLVSAGAIHYEPFGVYAGKSDDLASLPDGATVAVPNNVTNEARALLLLQQEGLIELNEDAGITATITDITKNDKNLKFKEIAPEQLVRALADVDIAIINGNYAIQGGLSVKDALAVESNESLAAKTYGNIVAVREEDKDKEEIKKLIEVLQSEDIKKFIEEKYDGSVVPLN